MNVLRAFITSASVFAALLALPQTLHAQAPWYWMDRSGLELMTDLAAGLPEAPPPARDSVLDRLAEELAAVDREVSLFENAWMGQSLVDYRSPVEPEPKGAEALLWALWEALGRLSGAEAAGDHEWVRTNLATMRVFAARASEALRAQADADERQARVLEAHAFARRSSRAEAEAALARIRSDGLPEAQRQLVLEGGMSEEELAALESSVLASPADSLGVSVVELYDGLAGLRRELAAALEASVREGYPLAASYRHEFTVGNPKDHAATVDLSILRASTPPGWRFALVGVDTLDSSGAALEIHEAEPGRLYRVTLPAGASARVATLVEPLAAVGEGATVRWAVEGRIGNELLGGIVQEMRVPGGQTTLTAEHAQSAGQARPGWLDWRWLVLAAGAALLLVLLLLFFQRRLRTS